MRCTDQPSEFKWKMINDKDDMEIDLSVIRDLCESQGMKTEVYSVVYGSKIFFCNDGGRNFDQLMWNNLVLTTGTLDHSCFYILPHKTNFTAIKMMVNASLGIAVNLGSPGNIASGMVYHQ
jgi:hypothetical protein